MSTFTRTFLLMLVLVWSTGAFAGARVALVIGNGAYRHASALLNPTNDAADVAAALGRLGFSVRTMQNVTFNEMRRALIEFGRRARGSEIAIAYFAGHGLEVGGENWLLPLDAELQTDVDAEQEAISLKSMILSVSGASKLGLVVLDACRNSPFAARMQRTAHVRSVERGLSRVEPMGSVLVAYAAKDGTMAADGTGRNSPFTAALLRHVETPGLEISFLFRHVRDDVLAATERRQEPFVYGSLSKDAVFLKDALPQPALRPEIAPPKGVPADEIAWKLIKDSKDSGQLQRFIDQFPHSPRRGDAIDRMASLKSEPETAPKAGGNTINTKKQEPASTDEAKVAALRHIEKPNRSNQFDGVWTIHWACGQGCSPNRCSDSSYTITIREDVVSGGRRSGKVSASGDARWSWVHSGGYGIVTASAALRGSSGSGRWSNQSGCSGSLSAKRN